VMRPVTAGIAYLGFENSEFEIIVKLVAFITYSTINSHYSFL
jgi:hypothetical protein